MTEEEVNRLEARMERKWKELVEAPSATPEWKLERMYDDYLGAVNAYTVAKQEVNA